MSKTCKHGEEWEYFLSHDKQGNPLAHATRCCMACRAEAAEAQLAAVREFIETSYYMSGSLFYMNKNARDHLLGMLAATQGGGDEI